MVEVVAAGVGGHTSVVLDEEELVVVEMHTGSLGDDELRLAFDLVDNYRRPSLPDSQTQPMENSRSRLQWSPTPLHSSSSPGAPAANLSW